MPHGSMVMVYLIFPTVQGFCRSCDRYVTTCTQEVHPDCHAAWRLMRLVSSWVSVATNSEVAAMFEISGSSLRRNDKGGHPSAVRSKASGEGEYHRPVSLLSGTQSLRTVLGSRQGRHRQQGVRHRWGTQASDAAGVAALQERCRSGIALGWSWLAARSSKRSNKPAVSHEVRKVVSLHEQCRFHPDHNSAEASMDAQSGAPWKYYSFYAPWA